MSGSFERNCRRSQLKTKDLMNFLSVNVQGAGCMDKCFWIRKNCHLNKVTFFTIPETKMKEIDFVSVRSFWGNASFMHVFLLLVVPWAVFLLFGIRTEFLIKGRLS